MSDQPRRRPFRTVGRGTAQAIVSLFILAFLLSGASYWLSVHAVQGQVANRASVVQLCRAGNDSRAQQITLWAHLVQMSAPPPHETAAQKQKRDELTRKFLGYIRHVFAPRNCTANLSRPRDPCSARGAVSMADEPAPVQGAKPPVQGTTGNIPFDPTQNVLNLVQAAIQRQDDLRSMSATHAREMQAAETRRIDEKAELRAEHGKELREIETARLDAIRAVDVGAVQRAAEVQATQAGALAAQVVATADAFRVSLAAALEPIQKDIRDLRDSQSRVTGGKEQVVETRDTQGETRLNVNLLLSIVLGAVAVITLVLYVTKK